MTSQNILKWAGPLAIAVGLVPIIFSEPAEGIPVWIGYLFCSLFILAGIAMTAESFHIKHTAPLVVGGLMLAFMILIFWIAFGPGERNCSISAPFFLQPLAELIGCRVPFGLFAILLVTVIAFVVVPKGTGKE